MYVWLNIVGGQFGAWIEMSNDDDNGPSVSQVLDAAKGAVADNGVKFIEATTNGGALTMLMLEVPQGGVVSRKKNSDGSNRGPVPQGALILQAKRGFEENGRRYTRAFQYYIEKARQNPPLTTTTYSIDNVIVAASASDEKVVIEDGDTVTIRLLVVAQPQ